MDFLGRSPEETASAGKINDGKSRHATLFLGVTLFFDI